MATKAQIYLYTGPEFGERDDAVLTVKKSLKKNFGTIEEHLFYLSETPLNQVMNILMSGTLFSDGVCVVCKNAELLKKKDDLQMISEWMENSEPSTALILISDEVSVDSKLDKLVPAENKKKFWEMFDNQKLPWVQNYFKKNGYYIEASAAQLILDMIENNTQELKNECERFFICFPKDHTITADDVDSILTHNREESAFTLFNQISNPSEKPEQRFEKGIEILQKIRLSKDNSSVMIIAGLASCFRKLVLWHKQGEEAIFGTLMRKQYRNAASIWTIGQATAILALLSSTDMEIRSNGTMMEDVLLQKLLYEIVIKKGSSMSTADYD